MAGGKFLEIKVTNLWANRQIGDMQLPSDCERIDSGPPKAWPQWLLDGKPESHRARQTFSSWNHWNKNDPLFPSGLIGPVMLRPAFETSIP